MTFDKFTIKAQEAVQEAVNTATRNGQQIVERGTPQQVYNMFELHNPTVLFGCKSGVLLEFPFEMALA